jgi:hypothetical protein
MHEKCEEFKPEACTTNARQSPLTKSLVSRVGRIGARISPWVKMINRPRTMYMLAAKRAGARRRRRSCMMKAPSSHWLKWPIARPI